MEESVPTKKTGLRQKIKKHGKAFLVLLVLIWAIEWVIWYWVLVLGIPIDGLLQWLGMDSAENQNAGFITIAFLMTQVTKIPRIAFTAMITPFFTRLYQKRKKKTSPVESNHTTTHQ